MDLLTTRFLCLGVTCLFGGFRWVCLWLLRWNDVAVSFPVIHEFAVVVYGLEDWSIRELVF